MEDSQGFLYSFERLGRSCYALCSVSGGKNVGGIAGYADTLKDCCAIVNCEASIGREGAVAG